ncbi:MAG: hypothetical protein ABH856_04450 [Patescibacteria group bacterium]|nr:hypothetical protein [Patescibacteria group bacterium]
MPSRRDTFFSPFNEFPYFTKELLRESAKKFAMPNYILNSYIYKALRNGEIISLKRNYYVTRPFYEKHKTDTSYLFSLANILLKPSYISLETALQYYGLFAEAVNYTISSVTLKLPREFKNRTGRYLYRKINEKLFTGFQIVEEEFNFTIALPHKAIFDYLYYHTNRFTKNVHPDLPEELRIDTDSLSPEEKKKLKDILTQFTSIKMHL